MDERSFGELTKRVAGAETRRGMLGAVAMGVAAPLLGALGYSRADAAADVGDEAFGFCRVGGFPCGRNQQCCTRRCREGVCSCAKRGKPCINRVGANCCSKKCRKGKCK
ncbi:MAG: hypothetical protein ACRDJC_01525 [Thermomicrobiales bacterium]